MLPKLEDFQRRRKLLGLTQNQLARFSGVSQSTISKMERKRRDPTYGKVIKIDLALEKEEEKKKTTARAKDIHTRNIVKVNVSDTILFACQIMNENGYSQLPVYDKEKVVGGITENTILTTISEKNNNSSPSTMKIEELMEPPFPKLDEKTPIEPIKSLLQYYQAVLMTRKEKIVGIITRADLLKLIKS